jgi:hypothetical protein
MSMNEARKARQCRDSESQSLPLLGGMQLSGAFMGH